MVGGLPTITLANFVLNAQGLFYIDYEVVHPYNAEWDFANWGIFYWLNREGIRRFRESGDVTHINSLGNPNPGLSLWSPTGELVRRLS